MSNFANTGSTIKRGTDDSSGRTSTGLSTQIIIKVHDVAVGALQNLSVTQTRPLARVNEIGTDGNIEIVPSGSTTYDISATRIMFDQLRLPEAFSRSFRFIGAQRIPFDIEIFDLNNAAQSTNPEAAFDANASGIIVMKYENCWFQNYVTPYVVENYVISETAVIWAETANVTSGTTPDTSLRSLEAQTDSAGIETAVNIGQRRGGLDSAGIIGAIFNS